MNVNSIIISIFLFIGKFESAYKNEIKNAFEIHDSIQNLFIERTKFLLGDYEVCSSIVFPELVRYSLIREKFENYYLLKFYTQFGKDYGDYSVGIFQMKPSFIEQLENDLQYYDDLKRFSFIWNYPDKLNEREIRKIRAERIINLKWQIDYIISFVSLLDCFHKKNETFSREQSKKEKVLLYSTSFNSGHWYDYDKIILSLSKKYFPYGKGFIRNKINYGLVSTYFYENKFKF